MEDIRRLARCDVAWRRSPELCQAVTNTVTNNNGQHFHLICSFINHADPDMGIKNVKSFAAMKIIDAIIKNPLESRKAGMFNLFAKNG